MINRHILTAIFVSLVGTNMPAKTVFLQPVQTSSSSAHALLDDEETDAAEERAAAIQQLAEAITQAEEFQLTLEVAPSASKTALQTAIATAKTLKSTLDQGGFLANLVSTNRINDAAKALLATVGQMQGISDYYLGVLKEIETNEQISSSIAFKAIITAAKSGVELSTSVSALKNAISTMRYSTVAYLQTVDSLPQNHDVTGLILNPSFDRGNMDEWLGIDLDLSKIDLSNFKLDNLASLASAVSLGMREGTKAVPNAGSTSMNGVDGSHYLYSNNSGMAAGQPIAQLMFGMPGGTYKLTSRMAVTPGLLRLYGCHVSVLTVSFDVLKELLGTVDTNNIDFSNILNNINLSAVLPVLLENGKMHTAKSTASNINTWTDVSLEFDIQKNDFVLVILNGGLTALVGTNAYKADNIQLQYLHAPVGQNEEDGIHTISATPKTGKSYDLSGRLSSGSHHGKRIIVRDGRKFLSR